MSTDLDTAIVGAGPYGLSIGAYLQAKRRSFQIFGSPLESWRHFMPSGMILKSEPFASNLWDPSHRFTLERYCRSHDTPYQPVGRPISLALFLRYAEWFQRSTQNIPLELRVINLRRAAEGLALQLADGQRMTSRRVVLATGHLAYSVMPTELSSLPEPEVLHSSRMAQMGAYKGQDITVIGAGQSALESAALLHEAGARVRVIARCRRVAWNGSSKPRPLLQRIRAPDAGIARGWKSVAISELPRSFRWIFPPDKRHRFVADAYGPSGAWWLRDRVQHRIDIWVDACVTQASIVDGRVCLRVATQEGSTTELITDKVIAATGYRVNIDRLAYLDPALLRDLRQEANGVPALSAQFETSVPGLYIVGLTSAPVFGPIMRFMYGAKHAAPIVARALRGSAVRARSR